MPSKRVNVTVTMVANPPGNFITNTSFRNTGPLPISNWNAPLLSCTHTPAPPAASVAASSSSTVPPANTTCAAVPVPKFGAVVKVPLPDGGVIGRDFVTATVAQAVTPGPAALIHTVWQSCPAAVTVTVSVITTDAPALQPALPIVTS